MARQRRAHAVAGSSVTPVLYVRHGGEVLRREEFQVAKTKVFISFDYDYDDDLKTMLVGQAKHSDSPFEIEDWSIKEASSDWKDKARSRIKRCSKVAVICGEHTDTATGVSAEIEIAREEKVSYFLLQGRKDKSCKKPKAAKDADKMYTWTWDKLKILLG